MLVIPAIRLGFTEQFTLGDNQELVPNNLGVYGMASSYIVRLFVYLLFRRSAWSQVPQERGRRVWRR